MNLLDWVTQLQAYLFVSAIMFLLGMVAMGVDSEKLTILAAFSILTILVISVLLIIQLSRLVSTVTGSAALLVSERFGTTSGSARTKRAATWRSAAPRGDTMALAPNATSAA